jgi:hypothetical protein
MMKVKGETELLSPRLKRAPRLGVTERLRERATNVMTIKSREDLQPLLSQRYDYLEIECNHTRYENSCH